MEFLIELIGTVNLGQLCKLFNLGSACLEGKAIVANLLASANCVVTKNFCVLLFC